MAYRITCIDDEIKKCMYQLQSIEPIQQKDGYLKPDNFVAGTAPEIEITDDATTIKIHGKQIKLECADTFNISGLNKEKLYPEMIDIKNKLQKSLREGAETQRVLHETLNTLEREEKDTRKRMIKLCQHIVKFRAFKEWCHNFDHTFFSYCDMSTIRICSVDFFGPRVGFLKFEIDIQYNEKMKLEYRTRAADEANAKERIAATETNRDPILKAPEDMKDPDIPNIVFLRGGAVTILVVITSGSGMSYSILVVQPRVAIGKFAMAELPAGMIDNDANFGGTAAKELEEETGIKINSSELQDLTEDMEYSQVYPSCGACDEFMKLYLYTRTMDKKEIEALQNKCTGAIDEGENIKLKIVPLDRLAEHSPDMKTLTALYLYEQRQKRIKMIKQAYE